MSARIHDTVIVGGGPAGLTAGIYAARSRMDVVLVERALCGGQVMTAHLIENFPGFPEGVAGQELGGLMAAQAKRAGLAITSDEVVRIVPPPAPGGAFELSLAGGTTLAARSVILATGARWNALGAPGEAELSGRGVSYCATCDGPLFRNKALIVVGGGNTALEDALYLTRFATKVTIIHRREGLRATKILEERAKENPKIEFLMNSVVTRIAGSAKVEGVEVKDVATGAARTVRADGVFILIGITPNSLFAKGLVALDGGGYVVADEETRTSCDGVFACGDLRAKPLRQVVTATGEGALAAEAARHYVDRLKGTDYK